MISCWAGVKCGKSVKINYKYLNCFVDTARRCLASTEDEFIAESEQWALGPALHRAELSAAARPSSMVRICVWECASLA